MDRLIRRPIAHRGLHSKADRRVENTLAAAAAAVAKGYAIECDIQLAKDGEAMVFHDFTLERLTLAEGRLDALTARELGGLAFRESSERISTLPAFLAEIRGRAPLIIEIKSRFDGDMRLVNRAIEAIADYEGPVYLKSFDPAIVQHMRKTGVRRPLGLVAQARYEHHAEWASLPADMRAALADLRDYPNMAPDFLSWHVGDLPHAVPLLCRLGIGMPVVVWTVRSEADRACAEQWADQIIFEGFEA